MSGDDVVVLDARNDYECTAGKFKGARTLPISVFTEFPEHAKEILQELKGKKVVTYCTGGVRCEKAVPWLVDNGVDAVQLKGGILAYLKWQQEQEQEMGTGAAAGQLGEPTAVQQRRGSWEGDCFVFDHRRAS